jgi:hypothetical protein
MEICRFANLLADIAVNACTRTSSGTADWGSEFMVQKRSTTPAKRKPTLQPEKDLYPAAVGYYDLNGEQRQKKGGQKDGHHREKSVLFG